MRADLTYSTQSFSLVLPVCIEQMILAAGALQRASRARSMPSKFKNETDMAPTVRSRIDSSLRRARVLPVAKTAKAFPSSGEQSASVGTAVVAVEIATPPVQPSIALVTRRSLAPHQAATSAEDKAAAAKRRLRLWRNKYVQDVIMPAVGTSLNY